MGDEPFFWFVAEHRECWSSSPGEPVHTATRELTGQFYRGIRGGMQLFGRGLDVSTGSPAVQQRPADRRERTPVCGAARPNGGLGTITPDGHRCAPWIDCRIGQLELLNGPEVYAQLHAWLGMKDRQA